ncbi:hypothetical protein Tco_1188799, partial [Tanacetum coccineum]
SGFVSGQKLPPLLGILPPPQLTAFGLTSLEKKKKRSAEILKEVFVKEDIVVDGMHRNLVPPSGVVPSEGLVINEPEIQNAIKVNSEIADEMFCKMILVIEARDDHIEARKILQDNSDNMGQN